MYGGFVFLLICWVVVGEMAVGVCRRAADAADRKPRRFARRRTTLRSFLKHTLALWAVVRNEGQLSATPSRSTRVYLSSHAAATKKSFPAWLLTLEEKVGADSMKMGVRSMARTLAADEGLARAMLNLLDHHARSEDAPAPSLHETLRFQRDLDSITEAFADVDWGPKLSKIFPFGKWGTAAEDRQGGQEGEKDADQKGAAGPEKNPWRIPGFKSWVDSIRRGLAKSRVAPAGTRTEGAKGVDKNVRDKGSGGPPEDNEAGVDPKPSQPLAEGEEVDANGSPKSPQPSAEGEEVDANGNPKSRPTSADGGEVDATGNPKSRPTSADGGEVDPDGSPKSPEPHAGAGTGGSPTGPVRETDGKATKTSSARDVDEQQQDGPNSEKTLEPADEKPEEERDEAAGADGNPGTFADSGRSFTLSLAANASNQNSNQSKDALTVILNANDIQFDTASSFVQTASAHPEKDAFFHASDVKERRGKGDGEASFALHSSSSSGRSVELGGKNQFGLAHMSFVATDVHASTNKNLLGTAILAENGSADNRKVHFAQALRSAGVKSFRTCEQLESSDVGIDFFDESSYDPTAGQHQYSSLLDSVSMVTATTSPEEPTPKGDSASNKGILQASFVADAARLTTAGVDGSDSDSTFSRRTTELALQQLEVDQWTSLFARDLHFEQVTKRHLGCNRNGAPRRQQAAAPRS